MSESVTLGFIITCYEKIRDISSRKHWDIMNAILNVPMNLDVKIWNEFTNAALRDILSHLEKGIQSNPSSPCQTILDKVNEQYTNDTRTLSTDVNLSDLEIGQYQSLLPWPSQNKYPNFKSEPTDDESEVDEKVGKENVSYQDYHSASRRPQDPSGNILTQRLPHTISNL